MTTYEKWAGGGTLRSSATTITLDPQGPKWSGVTMTTTSQSVRMPACKSSGETRVRLGEVYIALNTGSNSFTATDFSGGAIDGGTTVAANKAAWCICIDNSTTAGEWRSIVMDFTTGSITPITTFMHFFGFGTSSDRVGVFNQVLRTWSLKTGTMPENVSDANGAECGSHKNQAIGYMHFVTAIDETFADYDSGTDFWNDALDTVGSQEPFFSITYESQTGDFLWGLGGQGASDLNQVERYSVAGDAWVAQTDLTSNITTDGYADIRDGETDIWNFSDGLLISPQTSSYDVATGTQAISTVPPRVADAIFAGAMIRNSERFFECMGRITSSLNSEEVWEFNPDTEVYTQRGDVPYTAKRDFYMGSVEDKAYIYGGFDESGTALTDGYEYDPTTDTHTAIDSYDPTGDQEGKSSHAQPLS